MFRAKTEDFDLDDYMSIVVDYVRTGQINADIDLPALLYYAEGLTSREAAQLKSLMEEVTESRWHMAVDNIQSSAILAAFSGATVGYIKYKNSDSIFEATAGGIVAGMMTFFGSKHLMNKKSASLLKNRLSRAADFINVLNQPQRIMGSNHY